VEKSADAFKTRTRIVFMNTRCLLALSIFLTGCGADDSPRFQGYVDIDLVRLAPSQSGRLQKLMVARGDAVNTTQMLAQFDATPETALLQQAEAQRQQAEATARDLASGKRPEEIAIIRAQLAQAESNRQLGERQLKRLRDVYQKGFVSKDDLDKQNTLFTTAADRVTELRATLRAAELAARTPQRQAATATISASRANTELNRWKLTETTLLAPENGRIEQIYFRPGEWVNAGQPVIDIYALNHLKIRFFVPGSTLPHLKPGQMITIQCDGCAKDIQAQIRFISAQAEYTPPVIYSREQRQKLVYMVEATPSHPDLLRAGQPVDVLLPEK
jgi:HlyD family secretion protein